MWNEEEEGDELPTIMGVEGCVSECAVGVDPDPSLIMELCASDTILPAIEQSETRPNRMANAGYDNGEWTESDSKGYFGAMDDDFVDDGDYSFIDSMDISLPSPPPVRRRSVGGMEKRKASPPQSKTTEKSPSPTPRQRNGGGEDGEHISMEWRDTKYDFMHWFSQDFMGGIVLRIRKHLQPLSAFKEWVQLHQKLSRKLKRYAEQSVRSDSYRKKAERVLQIHLKIASPLEGLCKGKGETLERLALDYRKVVTDGLRSC